MTTRTSRRRRRVIKQLRIAELEVGRMTVDELEVRRDLRAP
jgi:hypothetical protein